MRMKFSGKLARSYTFPRSVNYATLRHVCHQSQRVTQQGGGHNFSPSPLSTHIWKPQYGNKLIEPSEASRKVFSVLVRKMATRWGWGGGGGGDLKCFQNAEVRTWNIWRVKIPKAVFYKVIRQFNHWFVNYMKYLTSKNIIGSFLQSSKAI